MVRKSVAITKGIAVIILLFVFNMFSSVVAYAEEVSCEQTTKIAEQKALEFSGGNCGELMEVKPLYDLCKNIVGYYYQYQYFYIVVGTDKSEVPIIEYGENQFFLNKIVESHQMPKKNVEYLYLGDLSYGYTYNGKYYKIGNENIEEIDVSLFASKDVQATSEIEEQWALIDNTFGDSSYKSGEIKNPLDYEKYYYSSAGNQVPSYNFAYEVMGNFSGYTNHCSPTAAVNLLKYWYLRNNTRYSCFLKTSWLNTFKLLYGYMGTNSMGKGTYASDMKTGYQKFFASCSGIGYTAVDYVDSPTFSALINEINAGYPFHLNVYGHNYYGNHSLLALGYKTYTYRNASVITTVNYLMVADGWNTSVRYVNCSVNIDSLSMISVRLAP